MRLLFICLCHIKARRRARSDSKTRKQRCKLRQKGRNIPPQHRGKWVVVEARQEFYIFTQIAPQHFVDVAPGDVSWWTLSFWNFYGWERIPPGAKTMEAHCGQVLQLWRHVNTTQWVSPHSTLLVWYHLCVWKISWTHLSGNENVNTIFCAWIFMSLASSGST